MSGLSQNPYGKKVVDSAAYIKDKGMVYSGAAISYGKDTAVYAGKKGYEIGKAAYSKIKDDETVKTVGGAVYSKAKSAIGVVGGIISSTTGIGAKKDEVAPVRTLFMFKMHVYSKVLVNEFCSFYLN